VAPIQLLVGLGWHLPPCFQDSSVAQRLLDKSLVHPPLDRLKIHAKPSFIAIDYLTHAIGARDAILWLCLGIHPHPWYCDNQQRSTYSQLAHYKTMQRQRKVLTNQRSRRRGSFEGIDATVQIGCAEFVCSLSGSSSIQLNCTLVENFCIEVETQSKDNFEEFKSARKTLGLRSQLRCPTVFLYQICWRAVDNKNLLPRSSS
jgi:hypothetical protein